MVGGPSGSFPSDVDVVAEVSWTDPPELRAGRRDPGAAGAHAHTRTQLVRERTRHAQRVHMVLEDANLERATVLSDVCGTAGRAILAALVEGETARPAWPRW